MEVLIPQEGNRTEEGRVIGLSHDKNRKPYGKSNEHPLLDTRVFDVQFQDRAIEKLSANRIAVNMYSSVDEYGYNHYEVEDIQGHRRGDDDIS